MTEKAIESKDSLFKRAYFKVEGLGKAIQYPIAKSQKQSEFKSLYTDLVSKILKKVSDLNDLRIDADAYSPRKAIEMKEEIKELAYTSRLVKDEYKVMFNSEMTVDKDVEQTLNDALGDDFKTTVK